MSAVNAGRLSILRKRDQRLHAIMWRAKGLSMTRPGIEILLKQFWWCEPTRIMQASPVRRVDESGAAATDSPETLGGTVECGR